jgi:hypothetical protein
MLWALAGSEGVGLLLLALLRQKNLDPSLTPVWPFGFAGLAALRGAAVYGMAAHLFWRQSPQRGRLATAVAVPLILLVGFSVVWSVTQTLPEVLVEYAAGALVLFLGLWWLEGYGLGPWPGPAETVATGASATGGETVPPSDAAPPGAP